MDQVYTEKEAEEGFVIRDKRRYKLILDRKTGKVREIYSPQNPRVTDRSTLFLTDDEVKRLIESASKKGDLATRYLAMIQLMLYSGLRRENIVNLKWIQIDFEQKLIDLEAIDVKTKMPIKVPIWDETITHLKILKGNKNDEGYIFMHNTKGKQGSKKKYSLVQINNIVATLGVEANIQPKNKFKNVNPHLLRHTWVRLCKKRGVRKDVLKIWGGWRTYKMIEEIYGMPDIDDIKSEYEKLKGDNNAE